MQVMVGGEEGRGAVLIDAPLGAHSTTAVQDPAVTTFPCTAETACVIMGCYCYKIKS